MSGQLAENVTYFVQALRAAGLPLGPSATLDALSVARVVGLERRDDLEAAFRSVLVKRREQTELFTQAFEIFWRNPRYLQRLMQMLMPPAVDASSERLGEERTLHRRLFDALQSEQETKPAEQEQSVEIDARFTFADQELLSKKDFDQMSAVELAEARRMLRSLTLPVANMKTRRFQRAQRGGIDPRASLRASLRGNPAEGLQLVRRTPRVRARPLVVLADVSGSMASYSRLLLFFLHAVTNDRDRVSSFVFGTRLTNITRSLAQRDVDEAVDRVTRQVVDWSGGTRIGACLDRFNRDWARRTLGQGATVLLITDGLDRGDDGLLEPAITRLSRLAKQVIWLNPLLRFDGYEAKARGARILLPNVDELRSAHNIDSLTDLAKVLST